MNEESALRINRLKQENSEVEQLTAVLLKTLTERKQTRQRLTGLLNKFRERVEAHFDDEEPGGQIRKMASLSAELAAKCKLLCEDHEDLAEQLDRIVKLAEEGTVQPEWWTELESRFHSLSIALANHAFREQELLTEIEERT